MESDLVRNDIVRIPGEKNRLLKLLNVMLLLEQSGREGGVRKGVLHNTDSGDFSEPFYESLF